ncbi:hypothetical protein BpHYR1_039440 [Brachionus plicatilis]|uniref:Uncharacterized protein n=1 Tax=Brachionus plicatilis TaxID=10195 RepID=A0A3M7S389_BRAPC|nr:hypothetical protein BpHYR1_039440 [Brachionus plicatilis]
MNFKLNIREIFNWTSSCCRKLMNKFECIVKRCRLDACNNRLFWTHNLNDNNLSKNAFKFKGAFNLDTVMMRRQD